MARFIKLDRLASAITSLANWRAAAQSQASAHLFPFLSLIAKGVNTSDFVCYEESDDFDFFDTYFRISEEEGELPPYFDPLTRKRRIATHPHSNVATARKSTFERSWQAGISKNDGDHTYWKLADDFADKIVRKILTRGGEVTRVNVLDVAVWLFRSESFSDDANAKQLEKLFRQRFEMDDATYDRLFEFNDEMSDVVFSEEALDANDIVKLVNSLELTGETPGNNQLKKPDRHESTLAEDDPILLEVKSVMQIGSSGVILRGCPGTGKTWYAWNLALELTGNQEHNIFRVQFHPSYGYEDFVEGYRPSEKSKSGFDIVDRTFMNAVEKSKSIESPVVFLIDEINRGDPSRVFGELLTFIENGWRETKFNLPYSGKESYIPRNLIIIATMNQHDRSITPLDMAMLRRFDHINILPSKDRVEEFLSSAGMNPSSVNLVCDWFDDLQRIVPTGIGHTYFLNVGDSSTLSTVWRYRILPFCESILEFDQDSLTNVRQSFQSLRRKLQGQEPNAIE